MFRASHTIVRAETSPIRNPRSFDAVSCEADQVGAVGAVGAENVQR